MTGHDAGKVEGVSPDRLIFVGGLHRSGTTVLGRLLADHPEVSGFSGTGASEDEGQHLQSVYPPARRFGGPGRFALDPKAHRLEPIDLSALTAARQRLMTEWSPYWDTDKPFLVEKSPPNLIMGRWLQALFPGSALVVIIRNPVVVALSTKKWTRFVPLSDLVNHWFVAHDALREDASKLKRLLVVRYEELLAYPSRELSKIRDFLNLNSELASERLDTSRTNPYIAQWETMRSGGMLKRRTRRQIIERYGELAARYGYDLDDLEARFRFEFPS